MSMWKNIRLRPPAKSLCDVDIPDASWKPDFDVADRYQNFANELMRISLLGIAGYGFLIKEVCMKDPRFLHMLNDFGIYLIIGAISLVLSLMLVLTHRFFSTSCLYYQIMIMRSLKRLGNAHWSLEEKKKEEIHLKKTRSLQGNQAVASRVILILASVFFSLGFIFVIVLFYKFINTIPKIT